MKAIVYRTRFDQTKHPGRKEFYYGVHSECRKCIRGNCDYKGSGRVILAAIEKHGNDSFIRETIKEFDNVEEAYKLEELIVTQDLVDNRECYNMATGGHGGDKGNRNEELRVRNLRKYFTDGGVIWNKGMKGYKNKGSFLGKQCVDLDTGKPYASKTEMALDIKITRRTKEFQRRCLVTEDNWTPSQFNKQNKENEKDK